MRPSNENIAKAVELLRVMARQGQWHESEMTEVADLLDPPIVKGSRVRHDVLGVTGVVQAIDSGRAWFTTEDGGEFVRPIEQLENIS